MDKTSKVLLVLFAVSCVLLMLIACSEMWYPSTYTYPYEKSKYHISKIKSSELDNDEIIKILYIGNSNVITGYVPIQVSEILRIYGVKVYFEYLPMMTLNDVIDEAIEEMERFQYDYVVLQDLSLRPYEERTAFLSDVKTLCGESRKHDATPVLYNPACVSNGGKPDKESLEVLTDSYKSAAELNDVILVNAAEAWIYVNDKHPEISLYLENEAHANDAGAYFTACVFVSTLFDLYVNEISKNNTYHGDDALQLGRAAWEFVSYYNKHGSAPIESASG